MGTAAVKGPPPKVSLPLRKMVWGLLVLIVAAGGGIAAWPSFRGKLAGIR
ncbi:MAG: hypothetical protein HYY65_09080 [Candidatus Tectomicrobia bacterium]|uniref:Uncharacterized protein n=1 Tax=Tectimicrobiota bacterium TaxID=2528274 RepID=A0A932GPX6_UNCTE|nr:hypothetical protein [Candidatus Tectomicrobia bacterium]